MNHIIYVKDKKLFYDPNEPRGGLIKHATAVQRLMKYDPKYEDEAAAARALSESMECGINHADILASRKATKTVNFHEIYEALRVHMPLLFRKSHSGQSLAYVVSANNEVTKIEYRTEDNLKDALMHPDRQYIWASIRQFYNTSELLEGHRDKLHFGPFIMMMIKNWLLFDERQVMAEEPVQISWDDEEFAYKKMDSRLLSSGPIPTWNEFLSRLDHPEVFKAWVWSIFEPTNNIRQIMWLRGAGNDGKSSVQKAIEGVIGREYCYSMKEGDEQQQWFQHNVYTKVLVNYADCKNQFLVHNSAIKQLTGGDTTSIEGKGENAFTGKIYSKLFVTSNTTPKINPKLRAHTSRIIKLDVAPLADDCKDAGFESRLKAEIYPFLYECSQAFSALVAKGKDQLNLPAELYERIITECASESHMHIMDFIETFVVYGNDEYCKASELNRALREYLTLEKHIQSAQVRHFEEEFKQIVDAAGCAQKRIEIAGKLQTVYTGFSLIKENTK